MEPNQTLSPHEELQRPSRTIFVIMPFTRSPERDEHELQEFFEDQLKAKIEAESTFRYRYTVHRSGNAFRITEQIIQDLFRADIVICDLSGEAANPNVMYELGVRLACSRRPVILIRERHAGNRPIFDIQGLHVHDYNPRAYSSLNDYLRRKINAFEAGDEVFVSPVIEVLEREAQFEKFGRAKVVRLIDLLQVGLVSQLRSFARTVNGYLAGRSEIVLSDNVSLLARDLWDNRDGLALVDWSEIRLVQGPHPALAYYLSTQYLGGIIDDKVEIAFSVALLRFYEAYFINVAWWFGFDMGQVIAFVQHSTLLTYCCGLLKTILQSEEGEQVFVEARSRLEDALNNMSWP